ncbi:MAG: hypothetical protein M1821_001781 [Bathelium mastoideum]|nr:MAG: hypothetical protein M1821_001781 [Bathelium mastoideum]
MNNQIADYINKFTSTWKSSSLALLGTTLGAGTLWLISDYYAWVAFGTGGTPANLNGYLKITKFRIRRALSGDDLKDASRLSPKGQSYIDHNLPQRQGSPPKIISRTLPQRQYPASLDPAIYKRLHDLPHKYAEKHPDLLILDKSITEGRSTDAIYAKPGLPSRSSGAKDKILGDEIAHVHPAENSLHVWLTEADAKKVVEVGWGERFPLSSLGMVHNGWTFLYAPRSMKDVDVIEEVVKAGIGNLTGQKV